MVKPQVLSDKHKICFACHLDMYAYTYSRVMYKYAFKKLYGTWYDLDTEIAVFRRKI